MCVLPHPLLLSAMSCEVIHRDFHALALFELAQGVCQQIKVKGVRVVEVIVVTGSQSLLFCGEDLRIATMSELFHSKLATIMRKEDNKNDFQSKILFLSLSL